MENAAFFSVVFTTNIGGVRHTPQVCYRLTEDLRKAVMDMVKKNLACVYANEVRFISGRPIPIRPKTNTPEKQEESVVDSVPRVTKRKKAREFE